MNLVKKEKRSICKKMKKREKEPNKKKYLRINLKRKKALKKMRWFAV
jgi:hypothetical protein